MAVVHVVVLWHVAQLAIGKTAGEVECFGLLVCCQVLKWHKELPQSVGLLTRPLKFVNTPPMWHAVHATVACAPARAKFAGGPA